MIRPEINQYFVESNFDGVPRLVKGLVVADKYKRVASFQAETIKSTTEMLGAMGLVSTSLLRLWHRMRRTDFTEIKHYGEIYEFLRGGELLNEPYPMTNDRAIRGCSSKSFAHASE